MDESRPYPSSSSHIPSSTLTWPFPMTWPNCALKFTTHLQNQNPPDPVRETDKTSANILILSSYVPRKCSATNRIIKANDHASVQISIGKVDENGRYTGENQSYALCGFIRARGESDDSLNRLTQRDGYVRNVWSASSQR
ncbi:hypothetical protein BO70DRAFT_86748 [Aspergillus heteromorphus CBS 117.55]|uniref:40S ribosomal protein S21 n=1 Tax=Aspergillus heteromorphus CBS 117.55 TaxID=1448321 RepID=A0A317X0U5_9EURO|nr:uncharacterized protein BO70DRAFT_86748 [Aspergillus heteromorphus CBS 117.55]PWY91157.1 hypothetical protein BO70DRAFT_86748 [Aspergillus heteromorphus CBS 117.55]